MKVNNCLGWMGNKNSLLHQFPTYVKAISCHMLVGGALSDTVIVVRNGISKKPSDYPERHNKKKTWLNMVTWCPKIFMGLYYLILSESVSLSPSLSVSVFFLSLYILDRMKQND